MSSATCKHDACLMSAPSYDTQIAETLQQANTQTGAHHIWRLIVRHGVGRLDFHHARLDGAKEGADHPVLAVAASDEGVADTEEDNWLDFHSNAGRSVGQVQRSHPCYISCSTCE